MPHAHSMHLGCAAALTLRPPADAVDVCVRGATEAPTVAHCAAGACCDAICCLPSAAAGAALRSGAAAWPAPATSSLQ